MGAKPEKKAVNLTPIAGLAIGGGGFDKLIHEQLRLAMVSVLAVNKAMTFNELKKVLDASDGNISAHARKLEDAGYISSKKQFRGRVPLTEFRLTARGRKALAKYLDHMEALIQAARGQ